MPGLIHFSDPFFWKNEANFLLAGDNDVKWSKLLQIHFWYPRRTQHKMRPYSVLQKIERLKAELHLLDFQGKQQNKHVFFFDTKKEGMKCLKVSGTV